MADDIVTRLRSGEGPATCWGCTEYGCSTENPWKGSFLVAAEDCICDCHRWPSWVQEAADEIERLRGQNASLASFLHPINKMPDDKGLVVGDGYEPIASLEEVEEFLAELNPPSISTADGGAWGTWVSKITELEAEIDRLRADLYHFLYCPISECHLCAGVEAARRNDPTWSVTDNAARTFSEYAAERDKKLSTEGQEALEAFADAHVSENAIFDARNNEEARRG